MGRLLVASTPAPADTGGGGTGLLRTVGAQLLLLFLRRRIDGHHGLGERPALPWWYGCATTQRREQEHGADESEERLPHLLSPGEKLRQLASELRPIAFTKTHVNDAHGTRPVDDV